MSGIRRNLLGSIYLSSANLVSQLALVPVFLHFWGAQIYGWWLVLFTVPAFFVFSDVGLSSAVGNSVTLALEQGRTSEAERSLNAAWKFQAIAWAAVFGVLVLLIAFFNLQQWLGVPELSEREFISATLLLCVYSLASLQMGLLAAIYRGARCYAAYLAWSAHARVLETGLVVLALVGGSRIVVVAGVMLISRILTVLAFYVRGRRLLPEVKLSFFSGCWTDLRPLLPSGIAFLSFPVANALINQGTVLVVNHVLGAPAVVLLSVCRQLARVFQQGTSIILSAFQPEVTSAYGAGRWVRVRQLQSSALWLPLGVAVPFVVGVTAFGATLVQWWTRKNLGVTWPLMTACSLEAVAFGCGGLCSLVPLSINRVRGLSIVYVITNALGLLVAGFGLTRMGIVALPLTFALVGCAYCCTGLGLGCSMGRFTFRSLFSASEVISVVAQWRARGG